MISIATARKDMKEIGISLQRLSRTKEFKVNFIGGKPETAYYTTDLADAIGSGKMMAKEREGHLGRVPF